METSTKSFWRKKRARQSSSKDAKNLRSAFETIAGSQTILNRMGFISEGSLKKKVARGKSGGKIDGKGLLSES